MRNFFGDSIHDKLFPNKIKRFTQEEKSLIDKFINTILREDKKSELEVSKAENFNDRIDGITEEIYKQFILKDIPFYLRFRKFYSNNIKDRVSRDLMYDGYNSVRGHIEEDNFLKDFEDDKSITGIFVRGLACVPKSTGFDTLGFFTMYREKPEYEVKPVEVLGIRTRYEGEHLTDECKHHIENVHLEIIKNAILKEIK